MFNWISKLFKKDSPDLYNTIYEREKLIEALMDAFIAQKEKNDLNTAVSIALLLELGKEDFIINREALDNIYKQNITIAYEMDNNANLLCWIEIKENNG